MSASVLACPLAVMLAAPAQTRSMDQASAPQRQRPTVEVVGSSLNAHPLLLRRISAELELRGFQVRVVPSPTTDQALGEVTLIANEGGTSLHWTPRGTDEQASVRLPPDSTDDGFEVAAVQLAEHVVATHEAPQPEPEPPPDEPKPEAPTPVEPPRPPRWRMGVGFSGLLSPGGLGLLAGPHLDASVTVGHARRFGVGLDTTVSAIRATVADHRVGQGSIRLHALWWPGTRSRVHGAVGAGAGTLLAWTNAGQTTVVATVSTRADLTVDLGPRLALWSGVRLDVAVPRVEVRTGPQVRATAGQPLLDIGLGLQIRG